MPEDSPILTPKLADTVLKLDAASLIARARKGEQLKPSERRYLLSLRDGGKPSSKATADNYEELAELLGVTARALREWRKLDGEPKAPTPEADGGHNVEAWRAFVRARGLKDTPAEDSAEEPDNTPSESALKRRRLLIDCQERELRFAIKSREYVSTELVREFWASNVARAIALLSKKFEDELPPLLAGMDALEIRAENGKVIQEFVKEMHAGEGVPDGA